MLKTSRDRSCAWNAAVTYVLKVINTQSFCHWTTETDIVILITKEMESITVVHIPQQRILLTRVTFHIKNKS